MGDDILNSLTESTIYCRSDDLVQNVAYKIKVFETVENKSRVGQMSNRVILHHSANVKLMYYLPNKYANVTAETFKKYNDNIQKNTMNYFVVNNGKVCNNWLVDIINATKKGELKITDFDAKVHKQASKRAGDHDQSPYNKRFKSEN